MTIKQTHEQAWQFRIWARTPAGRKNAAVPVGWIVGVGIDGELNARSTTQLQVQWTAVDPCSPVGPFHFQLTQRLSASTGAATGFGTAAHLSTCNRFDFHAALTSHSASLCLPRVDRYTASTGISSSLQLNLYSRCLSSESYRRSRNHTSLKPSNRPRGKKYRGQTPQVSSA